MNGDRYTGMIVSLEKGKLKFDTGNGTLDIPWKTVTALTTTGPVIVTVAGQPERTLTLATTPDGRLVIEAGVTVALADVTAIRTPPPRLKITGGANAGLLSTSGNTNVDRLRLDGEIEVRARANRYTGNAIVNHASDTGEETVRNATGSGRYDRFLSERLYINGSAIFTSDRFRDLDLRSAFGVAVGYQVADNSLVKMGVEGGYGYVHETFTTHPNVSYHALRESISVDFMPVGPRVVFFHRDDGFFGSGGHETQFVQTRNGVRLTIVGGLVATLQLDVDYDGSAAPGRKTTDESLGLTFGYRFGPR